MNTRLIAATSLALGLFSVAALTAKADTQDVIDYRIHIMASMEQQMAAIDQIVKGKIPPENIAVHAQSLAVIAATAKKAYEPKAPGGEAKATIWTNWPDFAKRLDELTAATAALAKSAQPATVAAVGKAASELNCNSCHEVYRDHKS
jgi:cytochrome c556